MNMGKAYATANLQGNNSCQPGPPHSTASIVYSPCSKGSQIAAGLLHLLVQTRQQLQLCLYPVNWLCCVAVAHLLIIWPLPSVR